MGGKKRGTRSHVVGDVETQRRKSNRIIIAIVVVFVVVFVGLFLVLMKLIGESNEMEKGNGTGGEDLSGFYEENPILKALPLEIDRYNDDNTARIRYTITYKLVEGNKDYIIMIKDYTGGNYEDAISKLMARGFEVDEDKIEYVDLVGESSGGKAF